MPRGFFSESEYASTREMYDKTVPYCGLCGLHKKCKNPKIQPAGQGKKKILIVAEAPGEEEDRLKLHLAGHSGRLLKRTLRKYNIELYRDCWVTNAVICKRDEYHQPSDEIVAACRPNLLATIRKYKPRGILLLGSVAMESLIPVIFKAPVDIASRWADYYIPCRDPNAWVVATYHPSFIQNAKSPVYKVEFKKHIKEFIKRSRKRPWKTIPDYENQVEIIFNPAQAAREIKCMMAFGGNVAFDYECNCLKSSYKGAKIYSCSICWKGKKTIAYPWEREAIDATSLLLKSSMGKIAANLKFENVWTKNILGHWVKNWIHDTMLGAHVINNSPKVSNLTFQAFVYLGMPRYNQHTKKFLKSGGADKLNRIKDIDLKDLLLYNGLDALLEYKLAMIQMKLLGEQE